MMYLHLECCSKRHNCTIISLQLSPWSPPSSNMHSSSCLFYICVGFFTGSLYNDPALKGAFKGEAVMDGRVVAVKTHMPAIVDGLPRDFYKRAIVVTRNPLDAILAQFNRLNSANKDHVGFATDALYEAGENRFFV